MTKIRAQIVDEKEKKVVELETQEFELDVYNQENPQSVINMVKGKFRDHIGSVPEELRELNQAELRKLKKPEALTTQLRLRFWYAYDEACFSGKKINMNTVTKGICEPMMFMKHIKDQRNLAFILCPIVNYETQVHDFLETSLFKMREGLDKIEIESSKDLLAVLKVYEVFDKRVNGDYKQTIKKEVKHIEEKRDSREIRDQIGNNKNLLIED